MVGATSGGGGGGRNGLAAGDLAHGLAAGDLAHGLAAEATSRERRQGRGWQRRRGRGRQGAEARQGVEAGASRGVGDRRWWGLAEHGGLAAAASTPPDMHPSPHPPSPLSSPEQWEMDFSQMFFSIDEFC